MPGRHNQATHGGGGGGAGGSGGYIPGEDLIGGGHADAIAQETYDEVAAFEKEGKGRLAGRFLYRGGGVGPHGDEALHHIAKLQGFEGKPATMSTKEMNKGVKRGDHEMFRGVRARDGKTPAQIHKDFREGEAYQGLGFSGNGSYMSSSRSIASSYGGVGRYALHRDAKVVDYRHLQGEQEKFLDRVGPDSVTGRVFADPGRYAAARGYDAIRWRRGEEVGKKAGVEDEWIVLNRTALIAEV